MQSENLIVVTDAGGFIGGNLVAALRAQGGRRIRALDIKPLEEWHQRFGDVENLSFGSEHQNCETAAKNAHDIYNLAANIGGNGLHREQQGPLHALRAH